jgi:DNA-binding NarL/FixJ family response regulator
MIAPAQLQDLFNAVRRSLGAGSRGYLLKSMPPEDLIEVIRIACHLF